MDIIQIAVTLIIAILLVFPMGKYLQKVITGDKAFGDAIFNRVDNFIYKISGISNEEMGWRQYATALIITNLTMALIAYVLLRVQSFGILNPNGAKGMGSHLSFNTAISFITNTNFQSYAGESGLSYFSQMIVITFLMFTSAASGLAAAFAFIRGITRSSNTLGNYYVDLVRIITRILLPLSVLIGLFLIWQGVPQTFMANHLVTTIEGKTQNIPLGPVASLESIKQLGTNGGGFFNANSAHPFENPTPLTNVVEMLCMMLIPSSIIYTFGLMLKNKKQGWTIFVSMAVLFLISLAAIYSAEKAGNPALARVGLNQAMGNMEGKEVRFGIAQSSLFTTVTTAFTTGAVNNAHDSLTPLGGLVPLWQMMLNTIFGGEGVGFLNIIMYAILTVFLSGLMVGRTPEFLGKKIESKEIKLVAIVILVHPFITLIPTTIALITKAGISAIGNSGFHGLTEILYNYTSAAANNGSAFAGLSTNNLFWNTSLGLVMMAGRYVSLIALLAVAGSFSAKKAVPATVGTFRTDNVLFSVILITIIVIVGGLTFFPAIALGPIAEHLTLLR